MLLGYGLPWLSTLFAPSHVQSPLGFVLLTPLPSVLVFQKLGVRGLLEHNGLYGWGRAPIMFGWLFVAAFLLIGVWHITWANASLTTRLPARESLLPKLMRFRLGKPFMPKSLFTGFALASERIK